MNTIQDSDTAFRCAYVPFVALNIAWDYADTVCNIAVTLRNDQLKPLTRAVRRLRRYYNSFRHPFITADMLRQETEHAEKFLAANEDVMNHIVSCLADRIRALSHLPITDDELLMMIAVYQAIIVIKAIRLYADDADRLIEETTDKKGRHTIIPNEALALFSLMEQFIGDFPLKPNDPLLCRFAQSLYISLSQIEFGYDSE